MYRVRTVSPAGTSADSISDLATTVIFSDDPLTAGLAVKAAHLTQAHTAIDAVRDLAGLNAGTFSDPAPAGLRINALHLTQMRSSINAARAALSLPLATYTDSNLAGVRVKTIHLSEIRMQTK
jgi:hypothetical protein